MKLKRSIVILLSVILLSSLFSCADGEVEKNLSVPLVELTVDTSRYVEEGFIDYVIINNSGVDIVYAEIQEFAFENGEWHEVPEKGSTKDFELWQNLASGESDSSMINLTDRKEAGRYMLMVYCDIPLYSYFGADYENGYSASAVFDLPERDVE